MSRRTALPLTRITRSPAFNVQCAWPRLAREHWDHVAVGIDVFTNIAAVHSGPENPAGTVLVERRPSNTRAPLWRQRVRSTDPVMFLTR